MAVSSTLTVLLFSLVLRTQALENQPLHREPRQMGSRLAVVGSYGNYSTAELMTKLEELQAGMQRLMENMSVLDSNIRSYNLNVNTSHNDLLVAMRNVVPSLRGNLQPMLESILGEIRSPRQHKETCRHYYEDGQRTSGVYTLDLKDGQTPMEVYCDMSERPGWVVFQRREDGSQDFFRSWANYEDGFGDLLGEFWLGNRNIHRLTRAGLTQLRVDLQTWSGSTAFANYDRFLVGDASSHYRLFISGYSGTAGDSLTANSGRGFSTYDVDHDTWTGHCANTYNRGGWWYTACGNANLNGQYGESGSSDWHLIVWWDWRGQRSLQRTEMKLR